MVPGSIPSRFSATREVAPQSSRAWPSGARTEMQAWKRPPVPNASPAPTTWTVTPGIVALLQHAKDGVRSDADALTHSLTTLRHAVLRDGFLDAVRTMADHDISVAQLATLMLLDAEGSMTVGDLATDLGRSLSATSRLVDQLVRRGI